MRRVLVFGTFDGLHKGHHSFLRQARRHGDHLTVVVTRDSNVEKQKGRRPVRRQASRLRDVRPHADRAMLGERKITYKLIRKLKPDIICVGYDQRPAAAEARRILRRLGMENVRVVRMKPYRPSVYKSSKLNKLR